MTQNSGPQIYLMCGRTAETPVGLQPRSRANLEGKTMVKIAIVDDEKKTLEWECDCIGKVVYEKGEAEIFPYSSAEEVAGKISQGEEYDVVITDIEFAGGGTGFFCGFFQYVLSKGIRDF